MPKELKHGPLKGLWGYMRFVIIENQAKKIMDHDMEVGFVFWFMRLIIGDPDSRP